MPDWFEQNAPKSAPPPPQQDWFAQNEQTAAAPQQQPADQTPPAISRFFSSLGEVLQGYNPFHAAKEYLERPAQWAAVSDVLGTKRGTPEEAAALERGMNVPLPLPGGMGEVMPMGFQPAARAIEQTSRGDIAGAAGTLTGGYGIPYSVAKVIPKVATQEGRTALAKTTRDVIERVETDLVGPRSPVKMMNQALRPINTNVKFDQAADTALPEIKVSEAAIGRPITNIQDMLEAVKDAKKRVWGQREAITGEQGARPITLEPVADAMERTITQRLELQDPARAAAIRAKAATYRGRTFTIQEAEDLLHGANDELHSYYAKNPLIRRVEEGRNPDTAALVSEGKVLRDRIYGELDQAGQGAGPRELSRRYGSLLNMEGEIYRRMKVADRQAQHSLAEQYATAQGLTEAGIGVLTGHPLAAAAGLLKKQLAKEMKEAMQTDRLIERTFRNYSGKPLAVTVQKMEPKGLLTSGPIITPPPADPSGITITTGPPLQPKPVSIRGALPPPPIVTPPPPDPSGISVVSGEPYLPPPSRMLPPGPPPQRPLLAAPPVITEPPLVDRTRGYLPTPQQPTPIGATPGMSLSELGRLAQQQPQIRGLLAAPAEVAPAPPVVPPVEVSTLSALTKPKRTRVAKAPTPAPVEEAAAIETSAEGTPRTIGFGKERTYSGAKEFTAFSNEGDKFVDRVEIKQDRTDKNLWRVEKADYEFDPAAAGRVGASRSRTTDLGSGLTKAEAKQVAEAYLTGKPDPTKTMREGVPFTQANLTGKVDKEGWSQHVMPNGQTAYTNGHTMFVGERPKGLRPGESSRFQAGDNDPTVAKQMMDFLYDATESARTKVKPSAAYRSRGGDIVVFDNGVAVDGRYFSHARSQYPDVTAYASKNPTTPILLKSAGKDIGLIMPMRVREGEMPASVQTLLKKKK